MKMRCRLLECIAELCS